MEIEGKIWKSKNQWLVKVVSLDIMTQGYSKEEALLMIEDAIRELISSYFGEKLNKDLEIAINEYEKGVLGVTTSDNSLMLALSLRRQREMSGSTVREAAHRLGANSPNAYAQYEKGKIRISLDKYEKLLYAANPAHNNRLRIG